MPTYTITLTDIEQKAFEYISTDVEFWIQNAVHERARLAIEEMVGHHIEYKLAKGETFSGNKEAMVMACTLPNAKARHEAMLQKMVDSKPA
jgi:hypothetical protein